MSNSTLEPIESARTRSQPSDEGTSDEAVHALFQKELGLVEVIAKQIYKSINGLIEMDELMNAGREGSGSASTPISTLARPLVFFELLDEAFDHAQGVYPHDVLELRRQRIRSGMWGVSETDKQLSPQRGKTR